MELSHHAACFPAGQCRDFAAGQTGELLVQQSRPKTAAASAWGIEAAVCTYDLSLVQVGDFDVRIYLSLVVNPFDPETEETQELRFVTDEVS